MCVPNIESNGGTEYRFRFIRIVWPPAKQQQIHRCVQGSPLRGCTPLYTPPASVSKLLKSKLKHNVMIELMHKLMYITSYSLE